MTEAELLQRIAQGEHSRQQFKRSVSHPDALATELAAFSNSGGGTLLLGVNDDGSIAGLDTAEVHRLNQLLGNAASQHVRPPISLLTENISTPQGLVMVVKVHNGLSKPYFDHQGRIWVKQGADKRQVTAREELQRMFQSVGLVYADLVPVADTTSADIDETAFRQYLEKHYGADDPNANLPLDAVLHNLGLGDGQELKLAGLMLFGRDVPRWRPSFSIKAVAFPGASIADTRYLDSQDISGTLSAQYTEALAFMKRNLHRVQGDQGFNSQGQLEIPEIVLQELLVNALVHRDYFTSAPIRILIFNDRLEILSPGGLPDALSVDDIRQGKTNRRNPMLAEHAFRLLPYRGLGSGIPRALKEWPQIELISEDRGNQFSAVLQRPRPQWDESAGYVEARGSERITPQVTPQVMQLLEAMTGEHFRRELQTSLGLADREHFRKAYLLPALAAGLVEQTLPDKPNSRLQKYRLSADGGRLLQGIQGTTKP
ncbi:MAG: putative DNA binding domain-containing protein [Lautropia sp.]|nr:putative DNA binding domain-containing protein [Lautropia sp.]